MKGWEGGRERGKEGGKERGRVREATISIIVLAELSVSCSSTLP